MDAMLTNLNFILKTSGVPGELLKGKVKKKNNGTHIENRLCQEGEGSHGRSWGPGPRRGRRRGTNSETHGGYRPLGLVESSLLSAPPGANISRVAFSGSRKLSSAPTPQLPGRAPRGPRGSGSESLDRGHRRAAAFSATRVLVHARCEVFAPDL